MLGLFRPAVASNAEFQSLFDKDGYLMDLLLWDRQMAIRIANACGVERLGDEHWRVLSYVRSRYLHRGVPPLMRNVCRRLGINREEAQRLFGGCQEVWKIAGLPNPGDEARAYVN